MTHILLSPFPLVTPVYLLFLVFTSPFLYSSVPSFPSSFLFSPSRHLDSGVLSGELCLKSRFLRTFLHRVRYASRAPPAAVLHARSGACGEQVCAPCKEGGVELQGLGASFEEGEEEGTTGGLIVI